MSAREKMLKSAIKSMMEDYDESVKRLSKIAKLDDEPFIYKEFKRNIHTTCSMCDSEDCEEIRYGNKRQTLIFSLTLCKSCQKKMAEFLNQ